MNAIKAFLLLVVDYYSEYFFVRLLMSVLIPAIVVGLILFFYPGNPFFVIGVCLFGAVWFVFTAAREFNRLTSFDNKKSR